jgi:hypothetical protein
MIKKRKRRINPHLKKARTIVWGLQRYGPISPFELGNSIDITTGKARKIISAEGRYLGPGGLGEEKFIKKIATILKEK